MQDRPMAYRDISTDSDRETFAGMHHTVVLNIRPVTDYDPVLIGPDNCAKPDPDLLPDRNIPYDSGISGSKKRHAGDLNIHTHNNIGN
jgi:hypothetical protein